MTGPSLDDLTRCWPLLEAMSDGVALAHRGCFVQVNEALVRIIGLPREALLGQNAFDLLDPDERARVLTRHQARVRGEKPIDSYEIRFQRGDGKSSRVRMEPKLLGPDDALLVFRDLGPQEQERQLLSELGELALRLQRARDEDAVSREVVAGLGALGFGVAVLEVHQGRCRVTQVSLGAALDERARPYRKQAFPVELIPGALEAEREGRAVYLDDAYTAFSRVLAGRPGATPDTLELLRDPRLSRLLVAPVRVRAQRWGLLLVFSPDLGSSAAAALSLLASQMGSALEAVHQIGELERQNLWLTALQQVATGSAEPTHEHLLPTLLPALQQATSSDGAALWLLAKEPGIWVLATARGVAASFEARHRRLEVEGSALEKALHAPGPQVLSVAQWPGHLQAEVSAAGLGQVLLVPLFVKRAVAGALMLARREERPYTRDELQSAAVLAAQLGVQLERARLVADLQHSYDELGRAQAELVKRERLAALGELAAVLAHEVRNPLGVMFNSLASLRRQKLPQEATTLLDYLGEEAARLDRLVTDLLDFVRPHQPRLEPWPFREVITEAVEATRRAWSGAPVPVELHVEAHLPPVPLDAGMMRQALINLLQNAVQASPPGRPVQVRVAQEERGGRAGVQVAIQDAGPGIPPDRVERIWQPFFTTRAAGSGLGLAVVKRIVEAHGAEMEVRSRLGEGTTFTLWLPLR